VGGRHGREIRRRARVRTHRSTAGAGRADLIGRVHDRERGTGRSGQRLSNWCTGPARKRERRSARVKKLAPTGWPHWAASAREGRERGTDYH
jgi:hypothetical protein